MALGTTGQPDQLAPFSQGLPPDSKVTGLGIAPEKALYLATDGRGLYWRRDIASRTPNNGLDAPAYATVKTGTTFVITTRCSYPTGWRHIRALDLKLARGHGPGDADPDAAWLEFDGSRDELRLYNFDTRTWSEGRPGSAVTLANRSVSLDLAHSSITQMVGVSPPTVEIRWALILHRPAAGNLQQYLRVTDDTGASTSWDKVGDLRFTTPSGG